MAEILNIENPTVTYILEMNVKVGSTDIETWIKNTSAKYTYELNEPKTLRFEWFLSDDNSKATLVEVFQDSDGAKQRAENLLSSPVLAEWQDRFEVIKFTVYGRVKPNLNEVLKGFEAEVRSYAGGFNKMA